MKAVCIGGGPGGLYFGICMKLRNPDHEILVVERNKAEDTFGWGVVFSDQTIERLQANDTRSADWILDQFAHWDDIEVHYRNHVIRSGGHGFSGLGRQRLLHLLQKRALELGVKLHFEHEIHSLDQFKDADLTGIPFQLIISEKNKKENLLELKIRSEGTSLKENKENIQAIAMVARLSFTCLLLNNC